MSQKIITITCEATDVEAIQICLEMGAAECEIQDAFDLTIADAPDLAERIANLDDAPPDLERQMEWTVFEADERLREAIRRKLPTHMQMGVLEYLEHGAPCGSFLGRLIAGDPSAWSHADHINMDAMRSWQDFLYNDMPSIAWGTQEKYKAWAERQQAVREAQDNG